ncbi:MAG: DNA topoisomerase IV subunit A [Pseudomonadota bacterium]
MSALTVEEDIRDQNLRHLLGEKYLSYALSTIMNRALPDVRDGLKPVHRRLLYAMRVLKLNPNSAFKKSARVVGDVIGKYHPHGDQSVYDALVRLAQEFSVRYPLIDGQGNFGNVDGDNPSAMRYTEARLTAIAETMLEGIDEGTVDFQDNYDGSEDEPEVLPSAFPNLLANGASGIAVGMATHIPPHNVGELCDGMLHLIKNPKAEISDLMEFIAGPDFPTGGVIIEPKESLLETYMTGKGGIKIRARYAQEDLGRGQYQIIVTEIPYLVQKSKLIEKIAFLLEQKKLPLLGDIRDESADDIRIILEPKSKNVDPELLMETLFKQTDLESRFSLNMNVLNKAHVPMVMSLKEVLEAFIAHRLEVLQRRSQYRLDKIDHRLEVLDGLLIAFLNLDEVIRIIREEDNPKQELISRFHLTEIQAEAILNLRLRSLAKIEEFEIKNEHQQLSAEKEELHDLLASPTKQKKRISLEIKQIKNRFGAPMPNGARRTTFSDAPDIDVEAANAAAVEREPITILSSQKGWIRAIKGHMSADTEMKYREGDKERFRFHAYTTDKLILTVQGGRAYTLNADKLPGGRSSGESVRLLADIPADQNIISLFAYDPEGRVLIASSEGRGFIVKMSDMVASTKSGKQILTGASPMCVCQPLQGDMLACVGENRKMLIYALSELPELAKGKGVILQKYKDGGLSDATTFSSEDGLIWTGRMNNMKDFSEYCGSRATQGRMVPRGFPRNGKFTL